MRTRKVEPRGRVPARAKPRETSSLIALPSRAECQAIVRSLLEWFAEHARDLPWRRTRDPYAIWVSEVMLQQTQVSTVLPYWLRWMRELPDIQAVARAEPGKLHKLWEGLGYYTRVRNLQQAARVILEKHAGKFPRDFADVLALPGIGRYTAGAICSIGFDQPAPILDGNVIRVITRLFGITADPRAKEVNARLWAIAEALVFEAAALATGPGTNNRHSPCSQLNQSLMELGALVCTPRAAKCTICPLTDLCQARAQNRVEELPFRKRPGRAIRRRFLALVCEIDHRFLVRQRPGQVVNAHLWEFPNLEVNGKRFKPTTAAKALLGTAPGRLEHVLTIKHTITRFAITLDVFKIGNGTRPSARPAHVPKSLESTPGRWLTLRQMRRLPFPSAHKKILDHLILRN